MSAFPGSPRLLRAGLVLLDPDSAAVRRVIALQYNPDTLTRTLQVQTVGEEHGARSGRPRLKGPPVETIKLEAEIDATDQLAAGDKKAAEHGLHPALAALETIVYPPARELTVLEVLANAGSLEIAPAPAPLVLFVWSRDRVVPVRLTEFTITEEAFDPALNPIRARVSLGMRVLSVNDLAATDRGNSIYMAYQRRKERLAQDALGGTLGALGLGEIP